MKTCLAKCCIALSTNLVMDVLDASLTRTHIPALQAQVPHAGQGQLSQVALLHSAAHQWHGDVSLQAKARVRQQKLLYRPVWWMTEYWASSQHFTCERVVGTDFSALSVLLIPSFVMLKDDACVSGPTCKSAAHEGLVEGKQQQERRGLQHVHYKLQSGCDDAAYLNTVNTNPRRDQSQNAGHQIYELNGFIVLIQALLPQLIQARASDN